MKEKTTKQKVAYQQHEIRFFIIMKGQKVHFPESMSCPFSHFLKNSPFSHIF